MEIVLEHEARGVDEVLRRCVLGDILSEEFLAALATAGGEEGFGELAADVEPLGHDLQDALEEFHGIRGEACAPEVARGLEEPRAVLIAGGRDKQGSYQPLVAALEERGRALVVIGEAAERLAEAAGGSLPIERAASMQQAVELARELAREGDAVLLSPACSSFDMFDSYKQRGRAFADAVAQLGGER